MSYISGLKCVSGEHVYAPGEVQYQCDHCGETGNLDVLYDYDAIAEAWKPGNVRGVWRYKTLMPINEDAAVPPLMVGDTPLYDTPLIAEETGVRRVWVKDDGRNPTASLKDRASTLLVAIAQAQGEPVITAASTGNAGAALAGLAASVGLPAVIFAPATAPAAKVAQLQVYGAHVMLVDGTYDDAFELCLKATEEFGWYNRNTGFNPYTAEGKKTVSYEIAEQLSSTPGKFRAPDRVFVSVGDGNIISGVHKGFRDLLALGWIDKMPRLMGVQAAGSSSLYKAWRDGADPVKMVLEDASSVADSIVAGLPRDRVKAMNAVRETDGAYIAVEDDPIVAAIPRLARRAGVFAEPAASATYAGLLQAAEKGMLDPDEEIVVIVTGSGLKDVKAAQQSVTTLTPIQPNLDAVLPALPEALRPG